MRCKTYFPNFSKTSIVCLMKQTTLSAGAVPVRRQNNQWEFLLLRSFKYWDFPKGMVEAGEEPWKAALREVEEETGLKSLSTPWGNDFYETEVYGKGKVARYYLVHAENRNENVIMAPNPVTGITEHHEYRWLPYKEALKLLVPRVRKVLEWANAKINASH